MSVHRFNGSVTISFVRLNLLSFQPFYIHLNFKCHNSQCHGVGGRHRAQVPALGGEPHPA